MYIDQTGEQVTLTRDCDAIQVPSGERMKLPAGSSGTITQALGGTYTVITSDGYMVRVQSKDADALGKELEGGAVDKPASEAPEDVEKAVWEELRTCYDPEIPINIADLGLVYACRVKPLSEGGNRVEIEMTLTAPGCPVAGTMPQMVRDAVARVEGLNDIDVDLVWDPPWDKSRMSEAAQLELGMY